MTSVVAPGLDFWHLFACLPLFLHYLGADQWFTQDREHSMCFIYSSQKGAKTQNFQRDQQKCSLLADNVLSLKKKPNAAPTSKNVKFGRTLHLSQTHKYQHESEKILQSLRLQPLVGNFFKINSAHLDQGYMQLIYCALSVGVYSS